MLFQPNPVPRRVPADADLSLASLSEGGGFLSRHVGPTPAEVNAMLALLGVDSLGDLMGAIIPEAIIDSPPADSLPPALGEGEALAELRQIATLNARVRPLIGRGFYGCVLPHAIRRNLLENPGWYTAYTPYQSEISQGRLELLLDFQQMVTDLTGLEVANASLLDEASAAAEAMVMMQRIDAKKRRVLLADSELYPSTLAVLHTRAAPLGLVVESGAPDDFDESRHFGILLAYPCDNGAVRARPELVARVRAGGGVVAVATDLLALTMIEAPGVWGAEIAIGSAQRFGMPMMGGGPHAAFLAASSRFTRRLPGRIVGVSRDAHGRVALRLALQTREQHIRREKATSNICTAQALPAMVAALYALWHGPDELSRIAERVHRLALLFSEGLKRLGFEVVEEHFFDTVTVPLAARSGEILARARAAGFLLRDNEDGTISAAFDESVTTRELARLLATFSGSILPFSPRWLDESIGARRALPEALRRQTPFLTHEVFHMNRAETEFMRYLRRLREKDIALDLSMIPLGSCTMKLNAAVELEPILWPEFSEIHPFAPQSEQTGLLALTAQLETWLARLAGFDAVSLQPNAGSQGEYAGLLAIRRYHHSRGETERDLCFIPVSAHGTNPASSTLAGFGVVAVECTESGDIDIEDLRDKLGVHSGRCGAAMITYPSTHGVFEEGVIEVIRLIHEAGGQVYMDGANMNALIGLCRPGAFGVDVSHFNLHKTFCIPHGGGGPGVGPIGVRAHLAPFLPHREGGSPVAAARYGSAGILPISWVYLRLMGLSGLANATRYAILNANYLAKVLSEHYAILYTGARGFVAHEFILDLRDFKESAGITETDVAKRLMDFGYHAPTVSWPVMGTMMVEPTESESKVELDRFASALAQIRREIARIESGEWSREDNPLVNAPHTAGEVLSDSWAHSYGREEAAYPLPWVRQRKYWPPVSRIDAVGGDRQLVCTCPPMDEWRDAHLS
ncbi:MAG: aminomethyl-transferring glycine dehydrogenase [Alphaproteobacteria bacterium]